MHLLLPVLLSSVAAAADCPAGRTPEGLSALLDGAEDAAGSRDIDTFRVVWIQAEAWLVCLSAPLTPHTAARYHAAAGLAAELAGDAEGASRAFRASREAQPDAPAPGWLGEGTLISRRWAEAEPAPRWIQVTAPSDVQLVVDGAPRASRAADRPAIYQAVGDDGVVRWSKRLAAGAPLPQGFTEAAVLVGSSSGRAELDEVARLLGEGDYKAVLAKAIPATSAYPELAASFQAAADIAVDQLAREREVGAAPAYPQGTYPQGPAPGAYAYGPPVGPRKTPEFDIGLDLGLPSGLRAEYQTFGRVVDGVGLRVGANIAAYGGLYLVFDATAYADFRLGKNWQLEVTPGFIWYDFLYGQMGLAVQWDPDDDRPIQAQVGMRVSGYGILADAGIALMW